MKISEGLREGDLKDLMLPFISIDEYQSKIGDNDEIIVIGFFLEDKEPAKELSKFIDRSTEIILDTDVSPAPNESGYYMVFVEIPRNKEFFKTIKGLLREIRNVTNITEWTFKTYGYEEIYDFNANNVERYVRLDQPTHESFELSIFFDNATVNQIEIFEGYVKIDKNYFKLLKISNDQLFESAVTFNDISLSQKLDKLLGLNYNTNVSQNTIYIYNKVLNRTAVLENDNCKL